LSPEEEKKKKMDLINKLNRLESKGYSLTKRFTMDNALDEIQQEYDRLVDAKNLEASLRFQRQCMMGVITGAEFLNSKFNPFDWELDGWSESVHENIEDFDEVFEELYDKYKGRGNMPPEAKLMMSLVGSGFMFHMSNSFFRSKMSNMDPNDIFRNNPQLAKQFAAAAAQLLAAIAQDNAGLLADVLRLRAAAVRARAAEPGAPAEAAQLAVLERERVLAAAVQDLAVGADVEARQQTAHLSLQPLVATRQHDQVRACSRWSSVSFHGHDEKRSPRQGWWRNQARLLSRVSARILHEAQRELVYSVDSIKQLASLLGFTDEAYFTRFFRKQTGTSPTEFRKNALLSMRLGVLSTKAQTLVAPA
jgi:AraC-like DNA-binding protein